MSMAYCDKCGSPYGFGCRCDSTAATPTPIPLVGKVFIDSPPAVDMEPVAYFNGSSPWRSFYDADYVKEYRVDTKEMRPLYSAAQLAQVRQENEELKADVARLGRAMTEVEQERDEVVKVIKHEINNTHDSYSKSRLKTAIAKAEGES